LTTPPADAPPAIHVQADVAQLNELQTSLVRHLAGGAARHDPARDTRLTRDQEQKAELVEVQRLKFCHETISSHFMHGGHRGMHVLTLLRELHAGLVQVSQLPPMVVIRTSSGDMDVACGNRRLYCLQRYATEAKLNNLKAWCIVYDLHDQTTPRNLVMKYVLAKTSDDGTSIKHRKH